MTQPDLDALEKLADEAAVSWPAEAWYRDYEIRWGQYGSIDSEDAAFMQAASPATIKALIAELKEAHKLLARIDRVYADLQDGNGNHPTELRKVRAFLARNGKGEG